MDFFAPNAYNFPPNEVSDYSEDWRVPKDFVGTWRIVEMGRWDPDFIDLVVPGYIRFEGDGTGEFQFGTVHGHLKYWDGEYRAKYRLFFTWIGAIESEAAHGTGWAEVGGGGMRGHRRHSENGKERSKSRLAKMKA